MKRRKLKLVLWDLDGTILDSRDAHFQAVHQVFKMHGLVFPMEGSDGFFGQTTGHIFNQVLGDTRSPEYIQKMLQEKEVVFRELISAKAVLLPGVGRWLKEFHRRNIRQVIASSTNKESIFATVKALEIDRFISGIFSGEHLPSKPNPAVFSAALEDCSAASDEGLVFEDSPHGIRAAKTLGLKCIAAAATYPQIDLAEADLVLEKLTQLQWGDIESWFA